MKCNLEEYKTKENMTSLCLKNQRFVHKLLCLQKSIFEASDFIGKCNTSTQKNHKLRLQLLL